MANPSPVPNNQNNGKPALPPSGLKRFGAVPEGEQAKGPSKIFTDYYAVIYLFMIAAFAAAAIFIHRPMIQEIKRLNSETQNRLSTTESERTYLKSVEGSVAAAQSIPAEIQQQVSEALPQEQNIPSLLVQFGAAALANSVSIDTIAFIEPKGAAGQVPLQGMVVPMDVSLSVRAPSYFEMRRFLGAIENSLRLMDVQSITLSSSDKAETSFSILLRVYTYQPPAAKQASADTAATSTAALAAPAGVPLPQPKP